MISGTVDDEDLLLESNPDERELPLPVLTYAVDEIALAALQQRAVEETRCHACDTAIVGEPGGRGLFMWTRGEERQLEEPLLCAACATAIGMSALRHFEIEEEEG